MSTRQRRIIELLLDQSQEITAAEIADIVGASARTIHRELNDIEPLLAKHGIMLQKKAGLGIKVEGEHETLKRYKQSIAYSDPLEYLAEERKILILCKLLDSKQPIKLFALAHELRVAMPTISHDLSELEDTISKQGLTLVRKRGYGIEIAGPEPAKRSLISTLAISQLDDSDVFGQYRNQIVSHPVAAQLLSMVGKTQFIKLEQALWELNDDWPTTITESDYTRLLIQLSVALTRIQSGFLISVSSGSGVDIDNRLLPRLMRLLGLELPIEEQQYLGRLLSEAALPDNSLLLPHDDMGAVEEVAQLIDFVQERLQMPLLHDRSLLEGLLQHIKPAFQRIREGIAIRNPMLAPIKKDYAQLFAIVREGIDTLYPSIEVPDEEIGYIVMHFGASLERFKPFPRKIKAVLVCTSGIGSSKLLAVKITKELPQIELIGHYSWYEAARMPSNQYDLIISTVDLPLKPEQYIKLSPLLSREESNKLRAYIEGTTLKKLNQSDTVKMEGLKQSPLDRIVLLQRYSKDSLQLLEGFHVHELTAPHDQATLEKQLPRMLALVEQLDYEQHGDKVAALLLAREEQGSLIIPDTELALLHTRSEWVQAPSLTLFRYSSPLRFDHEGAITARQVLMMLGPLKLNKHSLEILSEISSMLLLPDMISMLANEQAESIQAYISLKLEQFIQSKLDWRG